jgi:hypothetical protein
MRRSAAVRLKIDSAPPPVFLTNLGDEAEEIGVLSMVRPYPPNNTPPPRRASRTRAETAAFILAEAAKLDLRVGTDGTELLLVAPLRIPFASRRTFEIALENYRAEIIAQIIAENTP